MNDVLVGGWRKEKTMRSRRESKVDEVGKRGKSLPGREVFEGPSVEARFLWVGEGILNKMIIARRRGRDEHLPKCSHW
jgi:hypothetical protein